LFTGKLNELESCSKLEPWRGPPSIILPNPNYMPCCRDQVSMFPEVTNLPKVTFHTDNFRWLELQHRWFYYGYFFYYTSPFH
jgi:hypothetical protein